MKDSSIGPTTSYGRRAAAYWFVDGLPEILFGLALVVMATLAFLVRLNTPHRWKDLDMLVIVVGFPLYYATERKVLDFLKSRLTYPRTGYVQPPEEFEWRVPAVTILSLRSAPPFKENLISFRMRTAYPIWLMFFLFLANDSPFGRWLLPLVMPALAITMYIASRKSERPYRWWSAIILAVTGPLSLLANVSVDLRRTLPLLLAGVWLAVEGAFTLVHYLRANPHLPAAQGVQA
jgi:hypothetical protein